MKVAVIFGGSGFIGVYFSKYLLDHADFNKIYLYDCEPVIAKSIPFRTQLVKSDSRIVEINGDVRQPIKWQPCEPIMLTANFAAIHREPGHENFEYYETNLLGAEHVCAWAEQIGCQQMIFTSSIAPYGPSETEKNEQSLPVPVTAYGASKLVAEKIHQTWLARAPLQRHLVIVRPGVVFGPGEGGNVSRLIKAVLKNYFFYMANRKTCKSGIYVKELCCAMLWALENHITSGKNFSLFNMSMHPAPSIQEYVDTICRIANVNRHFFTIPYPILLSAAWLIELFARPFRIKHPFSPVRIRKLIRSNNICPEFLLKHRYTFQYTLETALADWKKDYPVDWN